MSQERQPPPESFDQKSRPRPEPSELEALITWGQGLAAMLAALSRLAGAELRLALGDLKRLLAIGVLVIPVSVFAWLGLSVLIGWWCYVGSGSVSLGLAGFIAMQVLVILVARMMLRRFTASIALSHTRAQWHALMQDFTASNAASSEPSGPGAPARDPGPAPGFAAGIDPADIPADIKVRDTRSGT